MSANPAAETVAPLTPPESGGVNPNVNTNEQLVETTEPQEKVSGDVTSFDELEQLHSSVGRGAPKRKQAPPKPKVGDIEVDAEGDAAINTENLTPKQQAKIRKFLAGDKDVELPEDAKVKITIDGEERDATVQELIDEFTGTQGYKKKFTELDTQKKDFETQQDQIQRVLNEVHEQAVTEKNLEAAYTTVARAMGLKPNEINQMLNEYKRAMWEKFNGVDEEAFNRLTTEDENKFYKREIESGQSTAAQQKEVAELEKRTDTVLETYKDTGLSYEKMDEYYKALKAENFPEEKITPELIGDIHRDQLQAGMVAEVVESMDLGVSNELKGEILKDVRDVVFKTPDLDWKKEDIEELLKEQVAAKAETKITKKVAKNKTAPKKSAPATPKVDVPITFDDLE